MSRISCSSPWPQSLLLSSSHLVFISLVAVKAARAAMAIILVLLSCISIATANHPQRRNGQAEPIKYWFDHFNSSLNAMQEAFWNGTYWPDSIQWTGAVFNTLLAASEQTYAEITAGESSKRTEVDHVNRTSRPEFSRHFKDVDTYYSWEDINQIEKSAYDDIQWVVLEWLEASKFMPGVVEYAQRARKFYNIVENKFDTGLCDGGLTWNPEKPTYKNAITNELFIASSAEMYLYWTGDDASNDTRPTTDGTKSARDQPVPAGIAEPKTGVHNPSFLDNAIKALDWFQNHNFTNDQGLIVDGYHLSPNQTTCDLRSEAVFTYNQGVILSGFKGLFDATGDTNYLDLGYDLINLVMNATGWNGTDDETNNTSTWHGLGRNGIMEEKCDEHSNCVQDEQAFKGIYFHHLDLFCKPLWNLENSTDISKTAGEATIVKHMSKCTSYLPWVQHNAKAALSTADRRGIIGGWWGASGDRACNGNAKTTKPWVKMCEKKAGGYGSQDANALGRGRTVETHASGLSVIKAALDFQLRYGEK